MSLSNSELEALLCSPSRLRALTDAELMNALRKGCNDAFAVLLDRYTGLVLRVARAILPDDGEAEEKVQRIFLGRFLSNEPVQSQSRDLHNLVASIRRDWSRAGGDYAVTAL